MTVSERASATSTRQKVPSGPDAVSPSAVQVWVKGSDVMGTGSPDRLAVAEDGQRLPRPAADRCGQLGSVGDERVTHHRRLPVAATPVSSTSGLRSTPRVRTYACPVAQGHR